MGMTTPPPLKFYYLEIHSEYHACMDVCKALMSIYVFIRAVSTYTCTYACIIICGIQYPK